MESAPTWQQKVESMREGDPRTEQLVELFALIKDGRVTEDGLERFLLEHRQVLRFHDFDGDRVRTRVTVDFDADVDEVAKARKPIVTTPPGVRLPRRFPNQKEGKHEVDLTIATISRPIRVDQAEDMILARGKEPAGFWELLSLAAQFPGMVNEMSGIGVHRLFALRSRFEDSQGRPYYASLLSCGQALHFEPRYQRYWEPGDAFLVVREWDPKPVVDVRECGH